MTIESKHYYPAPTSYNQFFEWWAGITFEQAQELAKMDNECGRFNQDRIAFICKLWSSYLKLTGRENADISRIV